MPKPARTCHSDDQMYTEDESRFLRECESFRQRTGRKFLVAVEYLRVVREMDAKRAREEGETK